MRKLWMPFWLYKLLPLLYLVSGLMMFALFGGEPLGAISGILLCSAGALVLALRIYTRGRSGQ